LRDRLVERLPPAQVVTSDMVHDAEHSVEALVPWLRQANPRVEIVPVLVATSRFEELATMAASFAGALGGILAEDGQELGRDVAIAISADAIHYGEDFRQTRFGPGGAESHARAAELDRALLAGPLAGAVTQAKVREAYETWVDPGSPGDYRWTWCGRFSIPFGLLVLEQLGGAHGWPLAYTTSVESPALPLAELGFGVTAPATLGHFVGYPAAAYTARPAGA
jgi:AmmeMemoRadiSam system protein B